MTVSVSNADGCASSDSITVTTPAIITPTITTSGPLIFCISISIKHIYNSSGRVPDNHSFYSIKNYNLLFSLMLIFPSVVSLALSIPIMFSSAVFVSLRQTCCSHILPSPQVCVSGGKVSLTLKIVEY